MRVKMPPAVRIVQDIQPHRGMQLLHREICCQGGSDSEPSGDAMTCRVCQRDFDVPDFLRLIHQWALSCGADPTTGASHPLTRLTTGDSDDDLDAQRRLAASLLRHMGPSIRDREKLDCAGSSPAPSGVLNGNAAETKELPKRSGDASEKKRNHSVVDAGANTNESGPWNYVCFTCKASHSSAWALVRHVQQRHQVKIYVDDSADASGSRTPSPTPSAHSSRPRSPSSKPSSASASSSPTRGSPSPRPASPSAPTSPRCQSATEAPPSSTRSLRGGASSPSEPELSAGERPDECPRPAVPQPAECPRPAVSQPGGAEAPVHRPFVVSVPSTPAAPTSAPPPAARRAFCVENILSSQFRHSPSPEDLSPRARPATSSSAACDEPTVKRARMSPALVTAMLPGNTVSPTQRDRPRVCEFCHKEFRFQSNLVVHRRIHTGEKPYRCRFCSHACTQSSKLRRHMKTHLHELGRAAAAEEIRDDDASTLDEEEAEERAEDERETSAKDMDGEDEPEDLSTRGTATASNSPSPAPALPTALEKSSLVGELIDKFGLSNINAYRDAYRQALRESGKENSAGATGLRDSTVLGSVADLSAIERAHLLRQELDSGPLRSMWLPPLPLPGALSLPPALPAALLRQAKTVENALSPPADLRLAGHGGYRPGGVDAYKLPAGLDAYKLPGSRDAYKLPARQDALKAPGPPEPFGLKAPSLSSGALAVPRRQRRDTCEYCGKVFKNGSNLTVHKRSHTGEKPYHCRMCNYACAQSSKLTRHMKTHGRMGKDVFQCRFCGMPFSVASTLEKHMRKCVVSKASKAAFMSAVLPGQS